MEILGGFLHGRKIECQTSQAGASEPGKGECDGDPGFDENQMILDTDMGLLTVRGKALHVSRLTLEKGEVDIEGEFESFSYSSNESRRKSQESFFGRLFR